MMDPRFVQGTPEWKAMRKNFIMASEAPIIMLESPYKRTPHDLWEEKIGLSSGQQENMAMRFGKNNEERARALYESMVKDLFVPAVKFHKSIPFMGASLDGINLDEDFAVEIKCTNKKNHDMAKEGLIPIGFKAQLQHQLSVLELDEMHYFSFHKGKGIIVLVKRDIEYMEMMHEKEHRFWFCVENLIEP